MTSGSLRFEGREIAVHPGDTVASALFRAGVRTFSRSLKSHRRRGLYCGTGECPNCMVTVDAGVAPEVVSEYVGVDEAALEGVYRIAEAKLSAAQRSLAVCKGRC